MTLEQRFEEALDCLEPVEALRSLVLELSAKGYNKTAIMQIFEKQRQQLRSANREAEEDAVMDVMDLLVGWCSPHAQLLADEPAASNQVLEIKTPPVRETMM